MTCKPKPTNNVNDMKKERRGPGRPRKYGEAKVVRTMITMSVDSKRLLDALANHRKENGQPRASRVAIIEEAFSLWQASHCAEVAEVRRAAAAEGKIIIGLWRRNRGPFNCMKLEPKCSALAALARSRPDSGP